MLEGILLFIYSAGYTSGVSSIAVDSGHIGSSACIALFIYCWLG